MLLVAAFVENFGYRQLMSLWRLEGIIKWILRTESSWGTMTRNASWSATTPSQVPTLPPAMLETTAKEQLIKPEKVTT